MVDVAPSHNQLLLDACRLKPTPTTPVWFMRQAGRYMAEYRRIREHHSLLDICASPDLATEVTLQPVQRLGVDAAILFADILLPVVPMGIALEFVEGTGPVIHNPIRTRHDIEALRPIHPQESLQAVLQTVKQVRRELDGKLPLIGFAGAPFTLASYLIEGGPSRHFSRTKNMMYQAPTLFDALLRKLATVVSDYALAQVDAGAQAIQIFDSWVGCLSPVDYERFVQRHTRTVLARLRDQDVPSIHFGVGTNSLLELMRDAGGDVLSLDWRVNLTDAWRRIGHDRAVQGNLDPMALFAPRAVLEDHVRRILCEAESRPGHIFNLGHGILPNTPVESVAAAVEMVHAFEPDRVTGGE